MKRWNVYGRVVGSKFLGTVEAQTEEEAIELAMRTAGHVGLCHQCAEQCEDAEIEDATAELAL